MRGFLTSIITAIAITSLQAQPNASKPKLVVGLTVDQLSTELIEAYWSLFGDNGFKKLWREGVVYKSTVYPFQPVDRASSTATINTGTTPYTHGIIANSWLDKSTNQPESCVHDKEYMGNYTTFSSSPKTLLSSTITDELNKEYFGTSLIYSIAPHADMAILMAGHAANGAFWFNTNSGKWASSTYYLDFPAWLSNYNDWNSVSFREGDLVWTPIAPVEKYSDTNSRFKEAFRHILISGNNDRYRKVVDSPLINHEVVNITQELFNQSDLGQDNITDYLQLGFYAGNTRVSRNVSSVESQDTYLRLDKNISDLLKLIDQKVGLSNTMFYLTSTGYRREVEEGNNYNIPTGDFYLSRSVALLNLYLIAKYGEGHYIEYYNDLQLYLDHNLIESKKLDLEGFQKECAAFLLEVSGVQNVFYSKDLQLGSLDQEKLNVKNAYHPKRSGDLILEIQPGWKVLNNDNHIQEIVSYAAVQAPTIFLVPLTEPKIINTPLNAKAIAPTVAKTIKIRAPNAADHLPVF